MEVIEAVEPTRKLLIPLPVFTTCCKVGVGTTGGYTDPFIITSPLGVFNVILAFVEVKSIVLLDVKPIFNPEVKPISPLAVVKPILSLANIFIFSVKPAVPIFKSLPERTSISNPPPLSVILEVARRLQPVISLLFIFISFVPALLPAVKTALKVSAGTTGGYTDPFIITSPLGVSKLISTEEKSERSLLLLIPVEEIVLMYDGVIRLFLNTAVKSVSFPEVKTACKVGVGTPDTAVSTYNLFAN